MPAAEPKGAVIVISSHVARGTVGNRAAVFTLETLGHPVWAVPTIILPWHLGHGPGTTIIPDATQFAELLKDLEKAPWLGEVSAVLSGFLGAPTQAPAVASLVEAVKRRNPKALYVCDPVIGDADGLYVSERTARAVCDHLIPLADIATPNRYELEMMLGARLGDIEEVMETAARTGPPTMLVTSIPTTLENGTGNLLLNGNEAVVAEHRLVDNPPDGTGDLTASLFLVHCLAGVALPEALRLTTASVFEVVSRASRRGSDELMLETDSNCLSHPSASVQIRRLSRPSAARSA